MSTAYYRFRGNLKVLHGQWTSLDISFKVYSAFVIWWLIIVNTLPTFWHIRRHDQLISQQQATFSNEDLSSRSRKNLCVLSWVLFSKQQVLYDINSKLHVCTVHLVGLQFLSQEQEKSNKTCKANYLLFCQNDTFVLKGFKTDGVFFFLATYLHVYLV